MKNITKFSTIRTKNHAEAVNYSRNVNNPITGIGINELKKIINKNIRQGEDDCESISILHISRYECPCCPTSITAIIEYYYRGKENNVDGLYKISIRPDSADISDNSLVVIEKLSGTIIHRSEINKLPKKNYSSLKQ